MTIIRSGSWPRTASGDNPFMRSSFGRSLSQGSRWSCTVVPAAYLATLPRRERRIVQKAVVHPDVSIHAPAKGATCRGRADPDRRSCFNPRSREGSDSAGRGTRVGHVSFQSTLPRRERQQSTRRGPRKRSFNPRSREGSDQTGGNDRQVPRGFNPRSREGSDASSGTMPHIRRCFNPRSRERSDSEPVEPLPGKGLKAQKCESVFLE